MKVSGPFRVLNWTFTGPGGTYGIEQFEWREQSQGKRYDVMTGVRLGPFPAVSGGKALKGVGMFMAVLGAIGMPVIFLCKAARKYGF
jgi:hypothetical protein